MVHVRLLILKSFVALNSAEQQKREHHLAHCMQLKTIKRLIDFQFIRISTQFKYNMWILMGTVICSLSIQGLE